MLLLLNHLFISTTFVVAAWICTWMIVQRIAQLFAAHFNSGDEIRLCI